MTEIIDFGLFPSYVLNYITHYVLRTDLFPIFRLASSKTDLAT